MIIAFGMISTETASQTTDSILAKARREMIQTQLVARNISDENLLQAFETVERHKFVDKKWQSFAYSDRPLPIGEDQTISQPYIVGLMTELLRLQKEDIVLEIGTGSGYQAAILAELAQEVYTIEIVDILAKRSAALLESLGYANIKVLSGDGFKGWPDKAPFDAIILTCAPSKIPQPLIDQLAEEGRLVAPVGDYFQELILLEKVKGKIKRKSITPVRFVPMTGEAEGKK